MIPTGLIEKVREHLIAHSADISDVEITKALRSVGSLESGSELLQIANKIKSQLIGYGPLEEVMQLPGLTDVLVHGDGRVFIEFGNGLEFTGKLFESAQLVRLFAQRLALQAKRRLDDSQPWVDAQLRDGVRLHALLAPIAVNGPQVSLRIPAKETLTLEHLVQVGSIPGWAQKHLVDLVINRESFLVIGGTGAGKTTILSALLSLVDPVERIITVEENAELRISHPHVVSLESRPATSEGVGKVNMQELLRQTLRMRPDRVVVGEVRGAEVLDLLTALNTGHQGSAATLHANSALEVPQRISALGLLAGLAPELSAQWLLYGVNAVILVEKIQTKRVIKGIWRADLENLQYKLSVDFSNNENRLAIAC